MVVVVEREINYTPIQRLTEHIKVRFCDYDRGSSHNFDPIYEALWSQFQH